MTRGRSESMVTPAGPVGLRRWGAGAPAVVLVHGAGGNEDSLARLADALASRGLAVATVSLPGRGDSGTEPARTVADAAAWLEAVLATVAPDGAVLAGHSMGGGVVLETALATDASVHGLVLLATGARLRVHPDILQRAAELVDEGHDLVEVSTGALRPDCPPEVRVHAVQAAARTPGPSALVDWQVTDRFDRLDDVADLGQPVLAVAGADDQLTPPKYAHFVANHAPDAEAVVLADAGHWLPVERAAEVAELVIGFTCRVAGAARTALVRAQHRRDWQPGSGVPPDPGTEPPFVHLSRPSQIAQVCQRRFADTDDLVLLVVDPARLPARVAWEDLAGEGEVFPHLYAPLPAEAIVDVVDYPAGPDGTFEDPAL